MRDSDNMGSNNLYVASDESIAEVFHQEVAQRLLAIRMSAALYGRQNEGRKSQLLAEQTLDMVDDVIKHFGGLMDLMRLPLSVVDKGVFASLLMLAQLIGQVSSLRCAMNADADLDELPSVTSQLLFHTVYTALLQLMLGANKSHDLDVNITVDAATVQLEIVFPGAREELQRLLEVMQKQGSTLSMNLEPQRDSLKFEISLPRQD